MRTIVPEVSLRDLVAKPSFKKISEGLLKGMHQYRSRPAFITIDGLTVSTTYVAEITNVTCPGCNEKTDAFAVTGKLKTTDEGYMIFHCERHCNKIYILKEEEVSARLKGIKLVFPPHSETLENHEKTEGGMPDNQFLYHWKGIDKNYPYYPKTEAELDATDLADQIGYLMGQYNAFIYTEKMIKGYPEKMMWPMLKKDVYSDLKNREGFETVFNYDKYRVELEEEFGDLRPEEYSNKFHARVLEMIPRIQFEMQKLLFKKMARLFKVEENFPEVEELADITEEVEMLEVILKDTIRSLGLKMEIEHEIKEWGKTEAGVFHIHEAFKDHRIDDTEETLGTTADEAFFEKAQALAENLYQELRAEIQAYLASETVRQKTITEFNWKREALRRYLETGELPVDFTKERYKYR
ncbi:MAG: hypothetical protein ACFFB5_01000 [Promethearchaeota archaeon]